MIGVRFLWKPHLREQNVELVSQNQNSSRVFTASAQLLNLFKIGLMRVEAQDTVLWICCKLKKYFPCGKN